MCSVNYGNVVQTTQPKRSKSHNWQKLLLNFVKSLNKLIEQGVAEVVPGRSASKLSPQREPIGWCELGRRFPNHPERSPFAPHA